MAESEPRRIPEATVARLPLYYRILVELTAEGTATVASDDLARRAGVNAAKVRKDLSYLGSFGTRGVGYDVNHLLFEMSAQLGLTEDRPVVIVGAGNLGQALSKYGGFGARGFPVVALVDSDPAKIGTVINGLEVRPPAELSRICRDRQVAIGIVATPAGPAQDVVDALREAGVCSVLNFAPAIVSAPEGVTLRKVDLAVELQILSFYQHRAGI